jgi:hypothetical protein
VRICSLPAGSHPVEKPCKNMTKVRKKIENAGLLHLFIFKEIRYYGF